MAVDHFHIVKLDNDMLTGVRRRVAWERHERRGRKADPVWAHRLLLLRGYDTLSMRGRDKLAQVLRSDDPTDEIGAAWGIKEALRLTLKAPTVAVARQRKTDLFDRCVAMGRLPEAERLKKTIDAWWTEIETFIDTQATNARTEAANVTIKNIKRTGRGGTAPTPTANPGSCSTSPPGARREHPPHHAESRRAGMMAVVDGLAH